MSKILTGGLGPIRRLRTATLLKNSCAVSAITEVDSPKQGKIRAWAAVTQTVPCSRLSKGAAVAAGMYLDETSGAIDQILHMAWDVTIHPGDRIEIDGDGVQWSAQGDILPAGTFDIGIAVPVVRVPR